MVSKVLVWGLWIVSRRAVPMVSKVLVLGVVDTMYQSLSSVYDAQILMASHSPVILSAASPEGVLCFAKTPEGATDIVRGDRHPRLTDWHGEVDLGSLFASGVLG